MKTDEKGSHRRSEGYRREDVGVQGTEEMIQRLRDERHGRDRKGRRWRNDEN